MKWLLVSILVATVACGAVGARARARNAGLSGALSKATGLFAVFMVAYLVVLLMYPVFEGRD